MTDEEIAKMKAELDSARSHLRFSRKWELLPGLIAMSLIAILAFAIVCLFLKPMPMTDAAGTLAVALVSAVTTNIGIVVGFFFGSSKDNKEKDETIRQQAQTQAVTATTADAMVKTAATVADTARTAATVMAAANGEPAAWEEAASKGTVDAYRAYLAKYPAGPHAAEATRLGSV